MPRAGKTMDRKRNARRIAALTRRDSIPPEQRCKTCDGTAHGLGGFWCIPCGGTGRGPRTKETSRG